MIDILYTSASNTFIQVGVFVGLTLLFFGFVDYYTHGGLMNGFKKHKHLQVLFGALLGLTPGCGGAIMVMPLYLKGHASFGTIVATLIATMGDAAFILLVEAPATLSIILLISFIVALITGYTLDYFKAGDRFAPIYTEEQLIQDHWQFRPEQTNFPQETIILQKQISDSKNTIIGHKEITLPNFQQLFYYFRHNFAYYIFWIILILSLPLGVMNLMQIDIDNDLPVKGLGWLGVIGTVFSVIYTFICKKFMVDDILPEIKSKRNSLKETFIHNAEETAFVVMWVFVALFMYETVVYILGGEEFISQMLTQIGYATVLAALFVGLIPGCGPHIILATLYIQGALPFSALIANAICNDGDALFPILVMDKRASLWATIFSLIPAWIVGTIFFLMGF